MKNPVATYVLNDIDDDYTVEVVSKLCSIPSVSGNEAEISKWVAGELRNLDLQVVEQQVLPDRSNVIATLSTQRPGPRLLFNGHLDTLPLQPGWSGDPYKPLRLNGRLRGAEITNMKAAVGGMISAVAALRRHSEDLHGEIVLSAVIGECDALGLGTTHMLTQGLKADAAINGEPTDLRVMTSHSGVNQLRLTVSGRGVHVCQHEIGINANEKLARIIVSLEKTILTFTSHPDFPGLPTINVGVIRGGQIPSMLADRAEALIDVRTVPGMTPESVRQDIETVLSRLRASDPGLHAEIHLIEPPAFIQEYPFFVSASEPVVKLVADAHEAVIGKPTEVGAFHPQVFFGTDASHLARAGIPTAIYGPGKVENINVPDESMEIRDFLIASRVYAFSAAKMCSATRA